MPYRRRRKTTRMPRRKGRKTGTRYTRKLRMGRPLRSAQYHKFRELYMLDDLVDPGTLTDSFYQFSFQWSSIPQLAHYQNLYDDIRIDKVTWFIEPYLQPSNASTGPIPLQKWARVAWDSDDATSKTQAQLLQYANVRSHNMGYNFKIACYPKVLVQLGTAGTKVQRPGFMDLQGSVPTFYCAKMSYPSLGYTSSNPIAKIRCEVLFTCRKQI